MTGWACGQSIYIWLGLWPSQMWLPNFKWGWTHVSSVSRILKPCSGPPRTYAKANTGNPNDKWAILDKAKQI